MPIESHIDEERRCVVAKISGDFTLDEIVETIDRSVRDPRFRPGFAVLSDHTAVGEPLTPVQARRMVDHLESLANVMRGSRWAVVTTKAASFGMLRMVSALAERIPMEIRVFSSHQDAEAWLFSEDHS